MSQERTVESSMRRTFATSSNLMPRSSRIKAFARRAMRCSSSPSLAIFTRSARSAGLRKLRSVFTRSLESILLIRSNGFRKSEDSRYTPSSHELAKPQVEALILRRRLRTPISFISVRSRAPVWTLATRRYGARSLMFARSGFLVRPPVTAAISHICPHAHPTGSSGWPAATAGATALARLPRFFAGSFASRLSLIRASKSAPVSASLLTARQSRVSSPVTAAFRSARRNRFRPFRASANAASPSAISTNSASIRSTMRHCSASGGSGISRFSTNDRGSSSWFVDPTFPSVTRC
jgi:hypothetical protein